MARYESDVTLFLKDLKKEDPQIEKGQRDGAENQPESLIGFTLLRGCHASTRA